MNDGTAAWRESRYASEEKALANRGIASYQWRWRRRNNLAAGSSAGAHHRWRKTASAKTEEIMARAEWHMVGDVVNQTRQKWRGGRTRARVAPGDNSLSTAATNGESAGKDLSAENSSGSAGASTSRARRSRRIISLKQWDKYQLMAACRQRRKLKVKR